jgi:ParB/RepB/Spo0J family partition protein
MAVQKRNAGRKTQSAKTKVKAKTMPEKKKNRKSALEAEGFKLKAGKKTKQAESAPAAQAEERVQKYMEVPLGLLVSNPMNPRRKFDGQKFDDLVASIRLKGILEPILVRPVGGGKKFEIMAGERRFRAACQVARDNGGMKGRTAPAMVREMSDDEAFDVMTIENLQREDLTELEEAESFKAYIDKRGEGSAVQLAERTGINITYIRRRVSVLDLPKQVLKAWEQGKLLYGHLEQLKRIDDKEKIREYTDEIIEMNGAYSVRELRDEINGKSPSLKSAMFDLEQAGCVSCGQNTDVQKKLFDFDGMDGAHCMNSACFKQKLNDWLQGNWKKTGYRKQYGTNGFRFMGENWFEFELFYGKEYKRCKECPDYVTLIASDGHCVQGKACAGDRNCFNRQDKPETKDQGPGEEKEQAREAPAWHGEYFREEFYKGVLPGRLEATTIDGVEMEKVQLFALIKSNHDLKGWFAKKMKIKDEDDLKDGDEAAQPISGEYAISDDEYDYEYGYISDEQIWKAICELDYLQARQCLREASIAVVMQGQFGAEARRMVADHIGISLKDEWRITKEYLDKKTKAEIFKIAADFKIFEDQKTKTFLFEKLLKKRGNFNSCKKPELVRVFLESGVELAGVVPEEILKD